MAIDTLYDPVISTAAEAASGINYIKGRVILCDKNVGIPDLLVVAYDLGYGTKSEEIYISDPKEPVATVPTTNIGNDRSWITSRQMLPMSMGLKHAI